MLLTMVGAAMIAAAAYDAATLTIPNWISLVLLGLFLPLALTAGLSWSEIAAHLAVGFGALAAGIALFATGTIGGGDAKFFAAVALYIGGASLIPFIFVVTLAGGALAFFLLVLRWIVASEFVAKFPGLRHLTDKTAGVPYGIAIAAGGLMVFPATNLFLMAAGR
jgi:prepilin peptidase CpaA